LPDAVAKVENLFIIGMIIGTHCWCVYGVRWFIFGGLFVYGTIAPLSRQF